jgi:hypothetical protein
MWGVRKQFRERGKTRGDSRLGCPAAHVFGPQALPAFVILKAALYRAEGPKRSSRSRPHLLSPSHPRRTE